MKQNHQHGRLCVSRLVTAFILLSLPLVQSFASGTSPAETIINLRSATLTAGELINQVEKQTGSLVVYSTSEVDASRTVRLKSATGTAAAIMKEAFDPVEIESLFETGYIVLKAKPKPKSPKAEQPVAGTEKQAYRKEISGVVSDAYNNPITGATIINTGSGKGTISTTGGRFRLEAQPGAVLQVSFLGYQTTEVTIGQAHDLVIVLQEERKLIDEIVVVGYGTQDKKTLTGSVSVVEMSNVETSSKSTVSQSLAGRAAGLRVNQVSAQAGGGSQFRIRGELSTTSNNPLIVVDGFPISEGVTLSSGNIYEAGPTDNILSSLNPDDIESITVLKDAASTSIYGSRAGHGVILVTTKRGAKERPTVNYSGNATVQTIAKHYEMLSPQQYMDMRNRQTYEEYLRTNALGMYAPFMTPPTGTIPQYKPVYTNDQIRHLQGTDWTDRITRTGILHQHNLSVRGGSDTFKYMASANYMKQQGIIKGNAAARFTVRANLDWDISKYFTAGLTATYSQNRYDNIPLGDGEYENAGILRAAAQANPTLPIRDANGDYSIDPLRATSPNPVSLLEITDKTVKDRILGSAFIAAKPIEGLELKLQLGADRQFQKRSSYLPKTVLEGMRRNGDGSIRQRDDVSMLMDLTATYTKEFGHHRLKALAGYSYEKRSHESVSARNNNFMIDGSKYFDLGSGQGEKPEVGSGARTYAISSYFGRLNYDYRQRYLFEFSVRADADSNFHPDNRWGLFPSVAVGWVVSEEEFMSRSRRWLSNLKIRASFGETGNSNVGYYIYSFYGIESPSAVIGDKIVNGIADKTVGNKDLTWETTREFNLGIDIGFRNNRFSLSFEYYNRTIRDLLYSNSLMYYQSVSWIYANGGKTQGQGYEVTFNSTNIAGKDFTWNTTLTLTRYEDRWKERSKYWKPAPYQKVNDPMRAWWSYESMGLMHAGETSVPVHQPSLVPGMVKLRDRDGDGVLGEKDMRYMGTSDPEIIFGLHNSLRWKNLDFSIYFYGELGMKRGASYMENWTQMQHGANVTRYAYETYTNSNRDGTRPTYLSGGNGWGDYYSRSIYFIRCGNINLGYTVPVNKKTIQNLRVYADVSNPFVITNWTGLDPETDNLSFSYPNVRAYTIGVNITF